MEAAEVVETPATTDPDTMIEDLPGTTIALVTTTGETTAVLLLDVTTTEAETGMSENLEGTILLETMRLGTGHPLVEGTTIDMAILGPGKCRLLERSWNRDLDARYY